MSNSTEMIIGKSIAISAETESAISKLPPAAAKLARAITESENKLKAKASTAVALLVGDAYALKKQNASRILHLVESFDMKGENSPFKSWGEFAKAAWDKSPAWISNNVRIAKAFLETNDERAKAIGNDFNFSQLQEMLPFVDKKTYVVSDSLYTHIDNGSITKDMPATGQDSIRAFIQSIGEKKEHEEVKVDIFATETGDYIYNGLISTFIPNDCIRVNFNPDGKDKDGTPWKGIIVIDRETMKAKTYLYHKHTVHTEQLVTNNETMKLVQAIRGVPEQFRKDIVASYKENATIDFEKLCFYIGFKVEDFS